MTRAERNTDLASPHAGSGGACVVPTVRYRDVPAAIDWLCEAFGFQEHRVVAGQNGGLRYAELTIGTGMVMVAPVEESAIGKLMVQPSEIGGVETQICYLFVANAKAHYARAKAAGADIVLDIEDQANGGRGYSCRDLEGHIWNFGTYDPWERQGGWLNLGSQRRRRGSRAFLAFLLVFGVATAAAAHRPARDALGDLGATVLGKVGHTFATARAEKAPDAAVGELREQLAKAHAAKAAAERAVREAREQLALERRAREAAELAAKELRERPAPVHGPAREASGHAAAEAREQIADMRSSQVTAARAAAEARAQLEEARSARDAAERAAREAREMLGQARGAKEAAVRVAREARALARRERRARRAAERAAAIQATTWPVSTQ